MQTGLEGVFLYGKKGKNKAEGCCSRQRACSSVTGSCRLVGVSVTVAHTDWDWGQVGAAIGDAGAGQAGRAGRAAQGAVQGGCGTVSKPQEE